MSGISIIKKPITDLKICLDILKDLKELNRSYDAGDFTELEFIRQKKDLKYLFSKKAAPFVLSLSLVTLVASVDLYQAFESGKTFAEFVGQDKLIDILSKSYDSSNLPTIDTIKNLGDYGKEYFNFIKDGTINMLTDINKNYLNANYILSTIGLYSAFNGLIGTVDFLAGETNDMRKLRDYETEELKLGVFRDHFHDPVFDTLNNEELYSMMITFNKTLQNYHTGKRKIIKNIVGFLDKIADPILKVSRQYINSSNNSKSNLINSVYDYIESNVNFENPELTFSSYGIQSREFKVLAASEGGVTKKDMINFVFKTNNEAMINAYKMKLKDDTIFAFSLKLEEMANAPRITEEHIKDLKKFKVFISGYEKNKNHLAGLQFPEDLKEMNSLIRKIQHHTIHFDPKHKKFTSFLEDNAPHLISRKQNGKVIDINNYSFLNYYEAERERIVKKALTQSRINEYTKGKHQASENGDRIKFREYEVKITELELESTKYRNIFGKESIENPIKPDDIIKSDNVKISTGFIDTSVPETEQVTFFLKNFLSEHESELKSGKALKEYGRDPNVVISENPDTFKSPPSNNFLSARMNYKKKSI